MRIVIIGAGKLGYSIAELLSKEQYDIVVVDQNEARLETVKDTLDSRNFYAVNPSFDR